MTNRDPHNTEFYRKTIEFYDCLSSYFSLSDQTKLRNDLARPDIDLVCFHELHQLREHARTTKGLNYNDFIKMEPQNERELLNKLGH